MRMCPVLAAWALLAVPAAAADPEPLPDLQNTIQPMLEALCVDCHSADDASGDFDIEPLLESDDFHAHREEWRRVVKNVRGGMMPPEDAEQPDDEQRKTLSDGVDALLVHVDCRGPVDPGRVTLRRLNRNEYRRTVRDLLGVDYQPADDFPADDVGYGFDNIGDVLSLPPILMEKYLAAAEEIAARAIAADNPSRGAILFKLPDNKTPPREAARPIVQRLAERAFRRPVQREEVDRLLTLFDAAQQQGDHFEQSVALPMQAVLVSPHFLFKVEPSAGGQSKDKVVALNDFELATRLSYFLWSSMPDDELLRMARQGKLRRDDVLEAQTRRMLADPKAAALTENFAGQWLQLRNLDALTFDEKQFAQFDAELAAAMRRETEMLFETIMREDRSILDFLRADFTFVNGPLAAHYGIDGVEGDKMRRVALADTHRGGVLTHASILAITSNPTRTSPVKRGKWILENLLADPPPPPAQNVPMLEEVKLEGTLRQRMEQHRENPACASCHQRMDPLGFALENFDAIGTWRDQDEGFPIDARGELPDGTVFTGAAELQQLLLTERRDDFVRCLTEKTLTYALGRGVEYFDRCAVDRIAAALAKDDYRFSRLVVAVALSDPFRKSKQTAR